MILDASGNPWSIDLHRPVNWSHPLNRGLVSWWLAMPHSGRRGLTWRDLCGRNHGTLTNGPVWGGAKGRRGGFASLEFDGDNDRVDGASYPANTFPCTVTAWARSTVSPASFPDYIYEERNGSGFNGWAFYRNPNFRLGLVFGGVVDYPMTSLAWTTNSAWYFVAMAITGNGGTATGYLSAANGGGPLLSESLSVGQTNSIPNTLSIGGIGVEAGFAFQGQIDSVRRYNHVLTAAEVFAVFDAERRGNAGLLNRTRRTVVIPDEGGGGTVTVDYSSFKVFQTPVIRNINQFPGSVVIS